MLCVLGIYANYRIILYGRVREKGDCQIAADFKLIICCKKKGDAVPLIAGRLRVVSPWQHFNYLTLR